MEDKLAYFAGLLDGEGSINLLLSNRNVWVPSITVSNCDGAVMSWLVDTFGGWVQTTKPKSSIHHVLYRWWFKGKKAIELLHKIFPLLIIKKEHAELIFQYENTRIDTQKFGNLQRKEHTKTVFPIRVKIRELLSQACKKSKSREFEQGVNKMTA